MKKLYNRLFPKTVDHHLTNLSDTAAKLRQIEVTKAAQAQAHLDALVAVKEEGARAGRIAQRFQDLIA